MKGDGKVSGGRMRMLAFLLFAEGFFYVALVVWQIVIIRLEFYRASPLLETLNDGFFLVMLGVGAFFVARARFLSTGSKRLLALDLHVSAFSFLLWSIFAVTSFGDANNYFMMAIDGLRPYARHYFMLGVLFSIIGAINISSMIHIVCAMRARQNTWNEI